jgi:hypothetical protein
MITAFRDFQINSKFRQSGSHESFQYRLDMPPGNHYTHIAVKAASIPRSYYLVQDGYNFFYLQEPGAAEAKVTVPAGNYRGTTFTRLLPTLINAASSHAWVYTVSYPNTSTEADTGKFTYGVTGNGGSQPAFRIPDDSDLSEQLGFETGSTNGFVADTLVAPNVGKFILEDCLYLHSSLVDEPVDILQEIYTAGSVDFGNITYVAQDLMVNCRKMKHTSGNCYSFALTNELGHKMSLNGISLNFSIRVFRLEYPQKDILKLLTKALAMQTAATAAAATALEQEEQPASDDLNS